MVKLYYHFLLFFSIVLGISGCSGIPADYHTVIRFTQEVPGGSPSNETDFNTAWNSTAAGGLEDLEDRIPNTQQQYWFLMKHSDFDGVSTRNEKADIRIIYDGVNYDMLNLDIQRITTSENFYIIGQLPPLVSGLPRADVKFQVLDARAEAYYGLPFKSWNPHTLSTEGFVNTDANAYSSSFAIIEPSMILSDNFHFSDIGSPPYFLTPTQAQWDTIFANDNLADQPAEFPPEHYEFLFDFPHSNNEVMSPLLVDVEFFIDGVSQNNVHPGVQMTRVPGSTTKWYGEWTFWPTTNHNDPVNFPFPAKQTGTAKIVLNDIILRFATGTQESFKASHPTMFELNSKTFCVGACTPNPKPDRFEISYDNTLIRVDESKIFTITALKDDASIETSYNTSTLTQNDFVLTQTIAACNNGTSTAINTTIPTTLTFINGIATTSLSFVNNVSKDVNLSLTDSTTFAPQTIIGTLVLPQIAPTKFIMMASAKDYHDNSFTYLDSDANQSIHITFDINATNSSNQLLTNYHDNCYAQDTNISFNYSGHDTSLNKVRYKYDTSTTPRQVTALEKNSGSSLELSNINSSIFSNGSTKFNIYFNFNRDVNKALNPFVLNLSTTTVIDVDGTQALSTLNSNHTFFYASTKGTNKRVNENSIQTTINYLIHCDRSCNNSLISGFNRHNKSLWWYINSGHDNSKNGNFTAPNALNIAISSFNSTQINSTYTGSHGFPYKTEMRITPSTWLLFNRFNPSPTSNDFNIRFTRDSGSTWSGKNSSNSNTKTDASSSSSKRLAW
jgi:hypothetical protein